MSQVIQAQRACCGWICCAPARFGNRLYIDVEIAADGSLPLFTAHRIAEQVHNQIEASFPAVKHCMVHVNPLDITLAPLETDSVPETPPQATASADSETPPV